MLKSLQQKLTALGKRHQVAAGHLKTAEKIKAKLDKLDAEIGSIAADAPGQAGKTRVKLCAAREALALPYTEALNQAKGFLDLTRDPHPSELLGGWNGPIPAIAAEGGEKNA